MSSDLAMTLNPPIPADAGMRGGASANAGLPPSTCAAGDKPAASFGGNYDRAFQLLWDAGITRKTIANMLGLTVGGVPFVADRLGLKKHGRRKYERRSVMIGGIT